MLSILAFLLGVSGSISFGVQDSTKTSHSESETARVSTIRAGNDLDITAKKSIELVGTQAAALGKVVSRIFRTFDFG